MALTATPTLTHGALMSSTTMKDLSSRKKSKRRRHKGGKLPYISKATRKAMI